MHRLTKILIILLPVLLLTITNCKSVPKTDSVELPPMPQRQHQDAPVTIRDYALLIVYYDNLVKEWELWGQTVTNQVNNEAGTR